MAALASASLGFLPSNGLKCSPSPVASLEGSAGEVAPAVAPAPERFAASGGTSLPGSPGQSPISSLLTRRAGGSAKMPAQQPPQQGSKRRAGGELKISPAILAAALGLGVPPPAHPHTQRLGPATNLAAALGLVEQARQTQQRMLAAELAPPLAGAAPNSSTQQPGEPFDALMLDDFDDMPGFDDLLMDVSGDPGPLFEEPLMFAASDHAPLQDPKHEQPAPPAPAAPPAGPGEPATQLAELLRRRQAAAAAAAGAAAARQQQLLQMAAASAAEPAAAAQQAGYRPAQAGELVREQQSLAALQQGPVPSRATSLVAPMGVAPPQPAALATGAVPTAQPAPVVAPRLAGNGARCAAPGASPPSATQHRVQQAQQAQQAQQDTNAAVWQCCDPSSLRPVKRAALAAAKPCQPATSATQLKLSPAASLLAGPPNPVPHHVAPWVCAGGDNPSDMRLLHFVFGTGLPPCWERASSAPAHS